MSREDPRWPPNSLTLLRVPRVGTKAPQLTEVFLQGDNLTGRPGTKSLLPPKRRFCTWIPYGSSRPHFSAVAEPCWSLCLHDSISHCDCLLFSSKDLLEDDFTTKVSLKCKKSAGPVAVTIETERGSGGALSSKIGTKFAYSGLSFDKLQLKADGGHVLETSMKPAPGFKVAFKGNKGADLCVDYTKGNLYTTAIFDVNNRSKFSGSACVGLASGVKLGGDLTYGLSGKTGVTAFNVGGSYASGPIFASVTSASKMSQVDLALSYKVSDDLTLASLTSHSSAKACDCVAVGGAYKASFADLKAKVGSDGIISASLVKDVAPKVTLTASGSVSASDFSNFKYGVGIVM